MTRANEVMTERPATVSSQVLLADAARMLEDLEIRHLPVTDDSGELVGMLSDRDVRGGLASSTRVVDVMNADVVQAMADDELADIAELMIDNRIGAVPIVDERGVLVGIVSYVDVLRSMIAGRR